MSARSSNSSGVESPLVNGASIRRSNRRPRSSVLSALDSDAESLVGREWLFARLERWWRVDESDAADDAEGVARHVLLTGGAGAGKTRAMVELARPSTAGRVEGERRGARVVVKVSTRLLGGKLDDGRMLFGQKSVVN